MGDWLETYRGTVFRWEVDHNDHFTVAYYFARVADAGLGLLAALGKLNFFSMDLPGSMREYQRAIELKPDHAQALLHPLAVEQTRARAVSKAVNDGIR